MEELFEPAAASAPRPRPGDAAALVLSRLRGGATAPAFVDGATGESLSFFALRQAALSLSSALRHGLSLQRGHAVLILSRNSLLLPQILIGVLAAGGVAVAADPDATPAEIAAAAHGSGAVMIVAAPEAAGKVAGLGLPLLLTSRSLDCLSAEELIDGGEFEPDQAPPAAEPSDLAFLAYSRTRPVVAMTHADLVAAAVAAGLPASLDELGRRRVCLASLPMCSAHGLPLIALALPAAGATTVLVSDDPRAAREAVAAHGATDVVAAPEAAAALAARPPMDAAKLSSLRRVIVAPAPLTPEAREQFRRSLPWVHLMEMGTDAAAVIQQQQRTNNSPPAEQMLVTNQVSPLKKIQNIILGDNIFSRSTTSKMLPITAANRQAVPKL